MCRSVDVLENRIDVPPQQCAQQMHTNVHLLLQHGHGQFLQHFRNGSAQFCFSNSPEDIRDRGSNARLPPVVPPSAPAGIYFPAANTRVEKEFERAEVKMNPQMTLKFTNYKSKRTVSPIDNVKRTVFRFWWITRQ